MGAEGSIGANLPISKNENDNFFNSNKIVIAGKIKVKHPLMDEEMILIGFVIENTELNQDDFLIQGLDIMYKNFENDTYSDSCKMYPKVIFDIKQHHASVYFKEAPLKIVEKDTWNTWYLHNGEYFYYEDGKGGCFDKPNFDYYMSEHIHDETPECVAYEILAVCKYKDGGKFKHQIFNLHELMLVSNE